MANLKLRGALKYAPAVGIGKMVEIPLTFVVDVLLNGIAWGLILALIAMGLNLIFGLMDIVNFAHGGFYALGAYIGFQIMGWGGNYWSALLMAPVVVAITGIFFEFLCRRFYREDPVYRAVYTLFFFFGLSWVLEETTRWIWGPLGIPFLPPKELYFVLQIGGFAYPAFRLFALSVSLGIAVVVWIMLKRTHVGLIIRAGIMNRDMVQAMGVDISKIYTLTFSLGVGIAAVAGMLAGPLVSAYPAMGVEVIIMAFVIVIVGGMGSFSGSIFSGILVGVVASIPVILGESRASQVAVFVFMAAVLLLRPAGLFGELER